MTRMRQGIIAWMLWCGISAGSFGQALPEWLAGGGTPRPPEFGVRDESGFFNRDSGAAKRISERLRKLEADYGYRILLMVEPVLIATTAPVLAAQLQEIWIPRGDGLVVVFESDNRGLGFGLQLDAPMDPTAPGPLVPTHEVSALLRNASAATDMTLGPEAYVEALMFNLADGFESYFVRRAAPPPPGRTLRLALLTIGALTILGLAAIFVGSLTRLRSMNRQQRFRFPPVDLPERLGAPGGGGSVTTRRFKPPSNS